MPCCSCRHYLSRDRCQACDRHGVWVYVKWLAIITCRFQLRSIGSYMVGSSTSLLALVASSPSTPCSSSSCNRPFRISSSCSNLSPSISRSEAALARRNFWVSSSTICDAWSMLLCDKSISLCWVVIVARLRESSDGTVSLCPSWSRGRAAFTLQGALGFPNAQVTGLLESENRIIDAADCAFIMNGIEVTNCMMDQLLHWVRAIVQWRVRVSDRCQVLVEQHGETIEVCGEEFSEWLVDSWIIQYLKRKHGEVKVQSKHRLTNRRSGTK